MHEFSIAQSLATQVGVHVPPGARLREVDIVAGALRALDPEAMKMSWEAVTFGTPMEGSVLNMDLRPWTITCSECGREWTSEVPFVECTCGNTVPIPRGGDELDLVAITVDELEEDQGT